MCKRADTFVTFKGDSEKGRGGGWQAAGVRSTVSVVACTVWQMYRCALRRSTPSAALPLSSHVLVFSGLLEETRAHM